MKKLMFIINGHYRQYTVINYTIENDFLVFTDTIDGKLRKIHKQYFTGEEEVRP